MWRSESSLTSMTYIIPCHDQTFWSSIDFRCRGGADEMCRSNFSSCFSFLPSPFSVLRSPFSVLLSPFSFLVVCLCAVSDRLYSVRHSHPSHPSCASETFRSPPWLLPMCQCDSRHAPPCHVMQIPCHLSCDIIMAISRRVSVLPLLCFCVAVALRGARGQGLLMM